MSVTIGPGAMMPKPSIAAMNAATEWKPVPAPDVSHTTVPRLYVPAGTKFAAFGGGGTAPSNALSTPVMFAVGMKFVIFAADDITYAWYREKGITELPYPRIAPGAEARYELDETLSLPDVVPMIAKPFSPGNAFPAEEVARERLGFDKAMIGSCTNGSYDDLMQAALVLLAARRAGHGKATRPLIVFPGSGGVKPAAW